MVLRARIHISSHTTEREDKQVYKAIEGWQDVCVCCVGTCTHIRRHFVVQVASMNLLVKTVEVHAGRYWLDARDRTHASTLLLPVCYLSYMDASLCRRACVYMYMSSGLAPSSPQTCLPMNLRVICMREYVLLRWKSLSATSRGQVKNLKKNSDQTNFGRRTNQLFCILCPSLLCCSSAHVVNLQNLFTRLIGLCSRAHRDLKPRIHIACRADFLPHLRETGVAGNVWTWSVCPCL